MKAIEINGLTKYYGSSRGVDGVSLQVEQGSFFGFIGPNGAGKSTTIRTLLGLIRPTSGQMRVLGLNPETEREKLCSRVGYLPSEAVFYPGMRVQEVLKLSADLRRKDCRERGEQLCQRLQLNQTRKAEELSFGNRKKLAIVCALQHDPELLILDEPTSGLDPLIQREFFDILGELNRAGTTVFMSSHVLPEIQHHCTEAAMIREGKIVACDRVEALSKTNMKRVHILGRAALEGLEGVRDLEVSGQSTTFLYSGALHPLLAALADGDIRDLTVTEPDLEEIFLHYYESGGGEK